MTINSSLVNEMWLEILTHVGTGWDCYLPETAEQQLAARCAVKNLAVAASVCQSWRNFVATIVNKRVNRLGMYNFHSLTMQGSPGSFLSAKKRDFHSYIKGLLLQSFKSRSEWLGKFFIGKNPYEKCKNPVYTVSDNRVWTFNIVPVDIPTTFRSQYSWTLPHFSRNYLWPPCPIQGHIPDELIVQGCRDPNNEFIWIREGLRLRIKLLVLD